MCTICAMTQTFAPERHESGQSFAAFTEGEDAPFSAATPYAMSVGDTFSGEIGRRDTGDWVEITLEAGTLYTITLEGAGSGAGTLSDGIVAIYSSDSSFLAEDDDSGSSFDARLEFTPTSSGTYYLNAQGFGFRVEGTYVLGVVEGTDTGGGTTVPRDPTAAADLDALAAYLTEGYWSDSGSGGRRAFDTATSTTITVDIEALTAEGQQLARWAFEAWEAVANVTFEEVRSGADIDFDDNDSGAYASSTVFGTEIRTSDINVDVGWLNDFGTTIDSDSFATYIHEIGHALGLGHQGNYNGNATYGFDQTFANDSWQISVMSYFSQSDNTTIDASYATVITPMMADILAIQDLYGAAGAGSATDGDTVWGANTTLTGYMGAYFDEVTGGADFSGFENDSVAFTIFDAGGIDTFDLSTSSRNNRFDMRAEYYSDIAGLIGNVGIARGTVLEHFIGGSGNDTVTGNAADNIIAGGGGSNVIDGGDGFDAASYESIAGAITVDLMAGSVAHASGTDTLSNIEVILAGSGADSITGNPDANVLEGSDGRDTLHGLGGDDSLYGGAGDDSLYGGFGFDTLEGGQGHDTLDGGENADALYGGEGNDELLGGDGTDWLEGGTGTDALYSGAGADRVFGGDGDDLIRAGTNFGNSVDGVEGGAGDDTIYGEGGYDLLLGGDGNDSIAGGNQADDLRGEDGNDTLDGGDGFDRLFGGNGDDLLTDLEGLGGLFGDAGNDTIQNGDAAVNIFGGAGNDLIEAGGGDDVVRGNAGFDTIDGGAGNDTLTGDFNGDTFRFFDGHGQDQITDFEALSAAEKIDLSAVAAITSLADLDLASSINGAATQSGAHVVIDTGGGNAVTLLNVSLGDLDAGDFLF